MHLSLHTTRHVSPSSQQPHSPYSSSSTSECPENTINRPLHEYGYHSLSSTPGSSPPHLGIIISGLNHALESVINDQVATSPSVPSLRNGIPDREASTYSDSSSPTSFEELALESDKSADTTELVPQEQSKPQKRGSRRIWTHALEQFIFTPHEIATLGTPHRRTIYLASLEAHTDRLHSQMLVHDLYPCHIEELEPFQGLNCKTAKAIVSGLQQDFVEVRAQVLELERLTKNAEAIAAERGLNLNDLDSEYMMDPQSDMCN